MVSYPYEFVQLLHEDRLRDAEKKRFRRQFGRRPSRFGKRLPRMGDLLVALGSRLNTNSAAPTRPHPPFTHLGSKGAR
jgi:hypothetical protein